MVKNKSRNKPGPRLGYISPEERIRIEGQMAYKGLRQEDLGPLVGVDQSNISRYLRGKMSLPTSVGNSLYKALELEMPSQFPASRNSFELFRWSDLFDNRAKNLKTYYSFLNEEEKIRVLVGLEALVDDDKPKSTE